MIAAAQAISHQQTRNNTLYNEVSKSEKSESREDTLRKTIEGQNRLKHFWRGIKIGLEANSRLRYDDQKRSTVATNSTQTQQEQPIFIIHPVHSWLKILWDIYISITLIFTALIVPYIIGFDLPQNNLQIIFDYFVTVCFGIDILLNFCTAYWDTETEKYIFDYKRLLENIFSFGFGLIYWLQSHLTFSLVTS